MLGAPKRKFDLVETPSRLHSSAFKPSVIGTVNSASSSSAASLHTAKRQGLATHHTSSKSNNRNKDITSTSRLDNVFSNESIEKYGLVIGAKLFQNGDLLVLRDGRFLSYYQDALTAPNPVSSDISVSNNYSAYLDEVDVVVSSSSSHGDHGVRCLTACVGQGSVDIMRIVIDPGDGRVVVMEHTIDLLDTNEEVTSITSENDLTVIGTSSNNIYLVRRDGERDITVDRLENSTNIFMGLLSSGVKMLGLDGGLELKKAAIVRLIPVGANTSSLLSVGSNLLLWSGWKSPGKESLKWSVKLADMLLHSIEVCDGRGAAAATTPRTPAHRASAAQQHLRVLDAMVLDEGATGSLLLVVLSAISDSSSDSTCSLWVHSVAIPFAAAAGMRSGGGACIEGMAFVTSEAHVTPSSCIRPRLCPVSIADTSSNDCFLVWPSSEAMHLCKIDARHLPRALEGDRGHYSCLRSSGLPVRSSSTLSVSPSGAGELSLLQFDGTVLTLKLREWEFAVSGTAAGAVAGEHAREEQLLRLLRDAAAGELVDDSSLTQAIERLPLQLVQSSVGRVSKGLVDQLPTGEHWGGDTIAISTGQYQLIKRLIEEKVLSHERLVDAVTACALQSISAKKVSRELLRTHQLLLACRGMSDWMQERPMSVVQEADVSAMPSFEETARAEAMQLLRQSIERRATALAEGEPAEYYRARGLTAADVFFASVSHIAAGAAAVAAELEAARTTLRERGTGVLVASAYGLASLLWTALQTANQGAGSEDSESSFSSNKDARRAVVRVLAVLLEACQLLPTEELRSLGVCGEDEERRLVRLAELLLSGYSLEASSHGVHARASGGEHMTAQWKAEYQEAKDRSCDLLLALGFVGASFALSQEHLHFRGMLGAAHMDPSLDVRLRQFLRDSPRVRGTSDQPALTFCFLWYESNRRIPIILDLGCIDAEQLSRFVHTRPHIAWMHYLGAREFALAAVYALQSGIAEPTLEAAERTLGVSKMCCVLAEGSASVSTAATGAASEDIQATAERAMAELQLIAAQQHISQRTQANALLLRHGTLIPGGDRLAPAAMVEELLALACDDSAHLLPLSLFDYANPNPVEAGVRVDAKRHAVCESFRLALAVLGVCYRLHGDADGALARRGAEVWSKALKVDSGLWFDLGRDIGPDGAGGAALDARIEQVLGQSMFILLAQLRGGEVSPHLLPRNEGLLQQAVQLSGLATEEAYSARIGWYIRAALSL